MNPTSTYFDQHILSADPVDLIRMLFGKAISLVQDARRHLASGNIEKRSHAVNLTYDILLELVSSLNDEAAPELCVNLRRLYFYMQQRLLDANLQQVDEPLGEVLGLLITLSEAWKPAAPSGPDVYEACEKETAAPPSFVHAGRNLVTQAYAA